MNADTLAQELAVLTHAPIIAIIAAAALIGATWRLSAAFYRSRIALLNDRIAFLKDQINEHEKQIQYLKQEVKERRSPSGAYDGAGGLPPLDVEAELDKIAQQMKETLALLDVLTK